MPPCGAVTLKNVINTETRESATQEDIVVCAECERSHVMGKSYVSTHPEITVRAKMICDELCRA